MRLIYIYIIFLIITPQIFSQTPNNDVSFCIPAKGKIASMYGWRSQKNKIGIKERKFHKGVDIAGKWGEKIYAAAAGEIVFVGRNSGYGLFIEIKHNDRYSSAYGHLKKTNVKKGDFVNQGEIIGEMGNSGTTFSTIGGKGIHLHFEIRDNMKKVWYSSKGAINPLKQINEITKFKKYDDVQYQPELDYLVSYSPISMPFYPTPEKSLLAEHHINVTKTQDSRPIELCSKKEVLLYSKIELNKSLKNRTVNYKYIPEKRVSISNKNYALQVEAHDILLSDSEVKALEKKYQTTGIRWAKVNINGKTWYKYTIGCFDDIEEAREYKKKLKSEKSIFSSAICIFEGTKITKTIWY